MSKKQILNCEGTLVSMLCVQPQIYILTAKSGYLWKLKSGDWRCEQAGQIFLQT